TAHCHIRCAATVAGSFVPDTSHSKVADKVGFTFAPQQDTDKGSAWLYSWALAIPSTSKKQEAAKTFTTWATSKDYAKLVAETDGVANVPPGTRESTYRSEEHTSELQSRENLVC